MGEVDVPLLYSALDAHRTTRGLSWREVATEAGIDVSLFSRMSHGRQPSLDAYVACCRWLGISADTFMRDQAGTVGGATLDSELAVLLHRHGVPGPDRDFLLAACRLVSTRRARQAAA